MPQADVIVDVSFLQFGKAAPKNSGFKGTVSQSSLFGGFTNYTGRDSATKNSAASKESGGETPPIAADPGSFADYTSRRNATGNSSQSGYFTQTNEGKLFTEEDRNRWISNSKAAFSKPGDLAWTIVVSLRDYSLLKKYGITDQNDFAKITQVALFKSFRKTGFDPQNMIWWEDYHTNTKHPHMHITFLEKENMRTRGKLTAKEIKDLKSTFILELAARRTFQEKYHTSSDQSLKELTPLRQNVVHAADSLDYSSIKCVYSLYQQLPSSGRLQYGSATMIQYRDQLDEIVDSILKSPAVRPAYDSFMDHLQILSENINKTGSAAVSDLKATQAKKLRKQIANAVLQNYKAWKNESGLPQDTQPSWSEKKAPEVLNRITNDEFRKNTLTREENRMTVALLNENYAAAKELITEIDETTPNGKFLKGAYLFLSSSDEGEKEKGISLMHEAEKAGNKAAKHFMNYRRAGYGMNKHTYHKIQNIVAPRLIRSARSACREQEREIDEEIDRFLNSDNRVAIDYSENDDFTRRM